MRTLPDKDIWLVLGAGISRSAPSNIPLWSEMKDDTIASILEVLVDANSRQWHNTDTDNVFRFDQTSSELQRAISMPEVVLESLCNVYLEPAVKRQLTDAINPAHDGPRPNQCHRMVAKLISLGKVKGVITPNFDRLLEEALEEAHIPHEVILPSASHFASTALPVYKAHGSLEDPDTLAFLRTAYMKGFPGPFVDYLSKSIRNSLIIICGYSGNDVDLFPLVRKVITDRNAANEAVVIDPLDLSERSPYSELKNDLRFIRATGTEFFTRTLDEPLSREGPISDRRNCTLLPHKAPFECALFVADALLSTRQYNRAYRYFYLADDIASDEDNRCGRGIATLGRSLCFFGARQNQQAVDEMETGRAMLEPIDLYDIESPLGGIGEGLRITSWLTRAKSLLTLTALAVASNTDDLAAKRSLAAIARWHSWEIYMGERADWYSQTQDAITSRASAVNRLFKAYEAFLHGNGDYEKLFSDCLVFCRNTGCIPELLACLSVLKAIQPSQRTEYERKFTEAADATSSDIQEAVRALFEYPGDEFTFTEKQWRWS